MGYFVIFCLKNFLRARVWSKLILQPNPSGFGKFKRYRRGFVMISLLSLYFNNVFSLQNLREGEKQPILTILAVWADFGLDLAQICIFGQLWAALQPCKYLKHPIKYILAKNISLGDYFFFEILLCQYPNYAHMGLLSGHYH